MLISEKLDTAQRCRNDFLAAKRGLQSAVASITANMAQMSAAIAAAQGLVDAEELAEWQAMHAEAQAALAQHADAIAALVGE